MNIIDVTLRDGGHAVNFDWPMPLAREYYSLMNNFPQIGYSELGYWKQRHKSANPFYNLDYETVCSITEKKKLQNVSVMIDYHYCLQNVEEYPTRDQSEIGMIRMCVRKEDMEDGLRFGEELKKYTQLNVSLNIFNSSNYSADELLSLSHKVASYPFDYIYFADTHGAMDLSVDFGKFSSPFRILRQSNKLCGLHLHDHLGRALFNYEIIKKQGVDSSDTSIRGMGKGSGNLKLEHVIHKDQLVDLAEFINKHKDILSLRPTPYELITARHSVSDNYAKQGNETKCSIKTFDEFCKSLTNTAKDSFDETLMNQYANEKRFNNGQ